MLLFFEHEGTEVAEKKPGDLEPNLATSRKPRGSAKAEVEPPSSPRKAENHHDSNQSFHDRSLRCDHRLGLSKLGALGGLGGFLFWIFGTLPVRREFEHFWNGAHANPSGFLAVARDEV
jgi:hypothetical protein